MAFTYGFFNSMNGDRKYNADQMCSIFDGLLSDGVFESIGDKLFVVPGSVGLQVVVKTGRAWFNHTWSLNDSLYPISLDEADPTLTRIDAIVLEVNHKISVRANEIKYIKGIPAASPVRPTMTYGDDVYQHPLAYVTVEPGATSTTGAMIDCRVGLPDCPYASGVLVQYNIRELFNIWDSNFNQWFDNIKAALTGNVVTNLQRQIDANREDIDRHWEGALGPLTKEILGLPEDAVPDDAFLALAMPAGRYAARVTVYDPFGRPVKDVRVNGLKTLNGLAVMTNVNGVALGLADNQTTTFSIGAPPVQYIDYNYSVPSQTVTLSTDHVENITFNYTQSASTERVYTSSTKIVFSDMVASFDCSVLGGGQNGGSGRASLKNDGNYDGGYGSSYYDSYGGNGGDGGKIVNKANIIPIPYEQVQITVGGIGGESSVGDYISSSTGTLTATGGTGGHCEVGNSVYYHPTGGGAIGEDPVIKYNRSPSGGSANGSFLYPQRTDIGGGGGGGGYVYHYTSTRYTTSTDYIASSYGASGASGGGNGGSHDSSNNLTSATSASNYGGGGGGGAVSSSNTSVINYGYLYTGNPGASGKSGLVGIVLHYK